MMICKRCGTRYHFTESGLCFHCEVATNLENAISEVKGKPVTLVEAGVSEGFPDWEKPRKDDKLKGNCPEGLY